MVLVEMTANRLDRSLFYIDKKFVFVWSSSFAYCLYFPVILLALLWQVRYSAKLSRARRWSND